MKYLVGYTDMFMSSLTGKLRSFSQFPSLGSQGYIIIGDYQGDAIVSPALIDVRLDIIELRALLQKLTELKFILQQSNFFAPNAQGLSDLAQGFLYNNENGILSIEVPGTGTLALPYKNVFLGDTDNLAQASPTILMDNLPDVDYHKLLLANSSNRLVPQQRIDLVNLPPFLSEDPTVNYGIYNLYTGGINLSVSEPIAPATTLRIDRSNLPNLSKGKIYMGVVNITPPLITIGVDGVTVSGDLNWDARGALPIVGESYAVPKETGLDPGTIFMGDFENPGQIIQRGLAWGQMFIGNGFGQITTTGLLPYQLFSGDPGGSGRIIPITILDRTNLPILPFNNVWIGDGLDQAFPIPIGASLLTTPELTIAPTGVVAGAYPWPAITINTEGRILIASDNTSTIDEIQDNIANNTSDIANNTTNIANNTSAISTISTTLFDPVTGIVTTIFAPVTGILSTITGILNNIGNWTNSSSISDVVNNNTSNIATNTSNIATNAAAISNILDNIIPSLSARSPCRVAATGNLNATYNNGSSGVGATLTNNGTQTALVIDGITLNVNDRILVPFQTTQYQNGIYAVTNTGSSSTNWVITRTTDFDGSAGGAIVEGTSVCIAAGTVNEQTSWMETGDGPFTVGTTPIIFTGYPGQSSITKVGTLTQGTWNATAHTVPFGGTGKTSFTPYSLICAGSTSTGNFQNAVGTGDFGQVFTSVGPGAIGVWKNPQEAIIVNQNTSTVTMVAGAQYFINNGSTLVTLSLPVGAAQGDTFIVVGGSSGGWKIVLPAGSPFSKIFFNSQSTFAGSGYLQSTNQYNCITIKCIDSGGPMFIVSNSSGSILIF